MCIHDFMTIFVPMFIPVMHYFMICLIFWNIKAVISLVASSIGHLVTMTSLLLAIYDHL